MKRRREMWENLRKEKAKRHKNERELRASEGLSELQSSTSRNTDRKEIYE